MGGWRKVWKLGVQQRIRVFLWVSAHGKLMTNLERWKRRMAANPLCIRCAEAEESSLQAIRDCVFAKEV